MGGLERETTFTHATVLRWNPIKTGCRQHAAQQHHYAATMLVWLAVSSVDIHALMGPWGGREEGAGVCRSTRLLLSGETVGKYSMMAAELIHKPGNHLALSASH